MPPTFLFQKNKIPLNYEILRNSPNEKQLLTSKFNSQKQQIVHLLYGTISNQTSPSPKFTNYLLYNWNITSNLISLSFQTATWNCTAICEITASQTFFLLEDQYASFLYLLNSSVLIDSLLTLKIKNTISMLDQTQKIRKKSDINKNHYVFASGKDVLVITYSNKTITTNLFPIPLIYNFNPNNFVLDTKLYLNRLYILYRSIATFNIYLYQFSNIQNMFQPFSKNTKLNETGITISEIFRFNNNYASKVIRFVRGINKSNSRFILWAYNDNQAYKCPLVPCIGYGYQIYENIVFSKVSATNQYIVFYGLSNTLKLKTFSGSLISEQVGQYTFGASVSSAEMISYSNNTINRVTIALQKQLFPRVYEIVDSCYTTMASQTNNFCKCITPYYYNPSLGICDKASLENQYILSSLYIAFITISSILLLTLVFILYKKKTSMRAARIAWKYNAADNIIFQ